MDTDWSDQLMQQNRCESLLLFCDFLSELWFTTVSLTEANFMARKL